TTVSIFSGELKDSFNYGLEKYVEEARTLAAFSEEPGIVSILNYFMENNTAYIVMPYLEGITLKEYIENEGGKISYNKALDIMLPVTDALIEVHAAGMLHRDISPENIFITDSGQVKLLDFGAARYSMGEHSKSLSIILKPGYAPSEQYYTKGKQGPWTDIYAAAATIYKAITGENLPEALERLDEDTLKKPSQLNIDIPKEAEDALMKALSVKITDRYQTVTEFQDGLRSFNGLEEINSSIPIDIDLNSVNLKNEANFIEPQNSEINIEEKAVKQEASAAPEKQQAEKKQIIYFKKFNKKFILAASIAILAIVSVIIGSSLNKSKNLEVLNSKDSVVSKNVNGNNTFDEKDGEKTEPAAANTGSGTAAPGATTTAANTATTTPAPVDNKAAVPSITNKTKDQAISLLKAASLVMQVKGEEYSSKVASGSVISQSIASGTKVDKNTSVSVVISKGVNPYVTFTDRNLEAAIRKAINKSSGQILKTDLASLTFLDISSKGISNLEGLQYAVNLQTLTIADNNISSISQLSSCKKLTGLYCCINKISNISPVKYLTNLKEISFADNKVTDISALSNLSRLNYLDLTHDSGISTLKPLRSCSNLKFLSLYDTTINDQETINYLISHFGTTINK
ncbi:MAG: protein kinase, partial [Bacillota bacterium]|nr:protein kinase [Bacillota bacterium]